MSWWVGVSNRAEFDTIVRQKQEEFRQSRFGRLHDDDLNIIVDERAAKPAALYYRDAPAEPILPLKAGMTFQAKHIDHLPSVFAVVAVKTACVVIRGAEGMRLLSLAKFREYWSSGRLVKNSALLSPQVAVSLSQSSAPDDPANQTFRRPTMAVTLVRTILRPDNAAKYGIPGVRGSISVSKSMFPAGTVAPTSLVIDFDGFVTPDAAATEKAEKRATKKAELAAKIAERAAKAQERAEKAATRAAKLQAQAEKLNAKANADKPAAPDAPVAE